MSEKWKEEDWAQDFWYSGKVTRRRVVGWGGGAIGAEDALLVEQHQAGLVGGLFGREERHRRVVVGQQHGVGE